MGNFYDPKERRLFIDASYKSRRAVLFHNGNQHRSFPVGQPVHLKESHETMKHLLDCLKLKKHEWKICGDLKVVGLIFVYKEDARSIRVVCMCLWDSRAELLVICPVKTLAFIFKPSFKSEDSEVSILIAFFAGEHKIKAIFSQQVQISENTMSKV